MNAHVADVARDDDWRRDGVVATAQVERRAAHVRANVGKWLLDACILLGKVPAERVIALQDGRHRRRKRCGRVFMASWVRAEVCGED